METEKPRVTQGNCPKCNSQDLEFGQSRIVDESTYYSYTCQDCDFDGEEVYTMVFCGHMNSKTNEMIDDGEPLCSQ